MSLLRTENGSIFYEIKGDGPRVTILRGLSRSSKYWLGFDEILAEHCEVLIVDHRGLGQSTVKMSWMDSISDIADDICEVWNFLGWEKSHLFGLSLGGMVVMDLAARFPERVSSLIVANSSARDSGLLRIAPKSLLELVIKPKKNFTINFLDLLLRMISMKKTVLNTLKNGKKLEAKKVFLFSLL